MSSSRSLRNVRDEPEEDDFNQLPLRRSLQQPRGRKPLSSSASHPKSSQGLSSPKKSRKKIVDTVYGPSKVSSAQIAVLCSLLRSNVIGFNVRRPTDDDRAHRLPKSHHVWFFWSISPLG